MKGKKGKGDHSKRNPHLNQNVSINVTHSSMESVPFREDQADVIIKALNLDFFKTKKCPFPDHVAAVDAARLQLLSLLSYGQRPEKVWRRVFAGNVRKREECRQWLNSSWATVPRATAAPSPTTR